MSAKGLVQFQGAENFPYRQRNFSRVNTRQMSQKERQSLSSMEAYSIRGISPDKVPAAIKAQAAQQIEANRRASLLRNAGQPAPQPQKLTSLMNRNPGFVGPHWPQTATP